MKPRYSGLRALTGPALLVAAPLDYLVGASLLHQPGLRLLGLAGLLGLAMVFSSVLLAMSGLGESLNLLLEYFSANRR